MKVLKNLTEKELRDFATVLGEKAFRGSQLFKWISEGAESFDFMLNLPKKFKEKLNSESIIGNLKLSGKQESKIDGTVKFLFELVDGNLIETVFMKYNYGNSLCVSSQAGCRMGCEFCASGKLGLSRNLRAWEILDQIIKARSITGEKISHVVVMGTGEPFDNYENLSRFIHLANDEKGLNLGMRNITVSTCGLVPYIHRFSVDFPQVNLAVSLHAPTDIARKKIMPVTYRYPLSELMDACRKYTEITHRRITFEYAVVKGVNDSMEDIDELARITRGINAHINLIPLNDTRETKLISGGRKRAEEIAKVLESKGVPATVRRTLGQDIDAACGQLRLKRQEECSKKSLREKF